MRRTPKVRRPSRPPTTSRTLSGTPALSMGPCTDQPPAPRGEDAGRDEVAPQLADEEGVAATALGEGLRDGEELSVELLAGGLRHERDHVAASSPPTRIPVTLSKRRRPASVDDSGSRDLAARCRGTCRSRGSGRRCRPSRCGGAARACWPAQCRSSSTSTTGHRRDASASSASMATNRRYRSVSASMAVVGDPCRVAPRSSRGSSGASTPRSVTRSASRSSGGSERSRWSSACTHGWYGTASSASQPP